MTEHHEATVNLAGAGNEPAPEEPVIILDAEFMNAFGDAMDEYMTKLDAIREKQGIAREQFPSVLHQLTTDIASIYISWLDYKADPAKYTAETLERMAADADENGMIKLPNPDHN